MIALLAAFGFGLAGMVRAATNDLTATLQRGLFEEEANRNLEAAAQAYEAVSVQFDKDRKLAATAIFRLGEIYRKQSRTNEAVAQYQRIVREFADQTTLATLSGQNLAGLKATPVPANAAAREGDAETAGMVARLTAELKLLHEMPDEELRAAIQMNYPNPVLTELLKQRTEMEARLAGLNKDYAAEHPEVIKAKAQLNQIGVQIAQQIAGTLAALKFKLETARAVLAQRGVPNGSPAGDEESQPGTSDDEQKEIRRIQAMIQNSPDLINSPPPGNLTPLIAAATAGRLVVAEFLLTHGADVNRKMASGASPLIAAAAEGHKAMVDLLLKHGAEISGQDGGGYTALHHAAVKGFLTVAETLLAHGADREARTADSNRRSTPLQLAAQGGQTELVKLLVAKGAALDATNSVGTTALSLASAAGKAATVKALLAAHAETETADQDGRTALSWASGQGNLDLVKTLLAGKARPDGGSVDLPLMLAIRLRNLELAELLLAAGADPNRASLSSEAAVPPHSGINPSRDQKYGPYLPLQIAVAHSAAATARLLFKFNADANVAVTWFNSAAQALVCYTVQDPEVLNAFLEAGANPNTISRGGDALIFTAASIGAANLEPLTRHQARTEVISGQNGWTPLYAAASRGDLKAVELLVAARADVNATNRDGTVALDAAVFGGPEEVAKVLLEHGADPNWRSALGGTPLHWAFYNDVNPKLVELLLAKGADPNLRDNNGNTALDLARNRAGPTPGVPPYALPARGLAPQRSSRFSGGDTGTGSDLVKLLRDHGARDDVPRLDRIELRRASANFVEPLLWAGTNDWNHFTLLELIALHYGFISTLPNAPWRIDQSGGGASFWSQAKCQFPDLSQIRIRRPAPAGAPRTETVVNVSTLLESGDCSGDPALQAGDIVEIPELDHPVNARWSGIPGADTTNLLRCITREVNIIVKGTPTRMRIEPKYLEPFPGSNFQGFTQTRCSFHLLSVLSESKLLRASSDLAGVKVTRHDAASGATQEWVIDCTTPNPGNDLWLRNGDTIEVPDK